MKRYLIVLALVAGIVTASVATATATPYQEFKQTRIKIHNAVDTAKQNRCRGHAAPFKFRAYQIPARLWPGTLRFWRERRAIARSKVSICAIPTIRRIFGSYAGEAIDVADCETGGTFSLGATNGQYVGLFQMGRSERQDYGWYTAGARAPVQVRSAYNYFVASGSDWSPWQCQPGGSLQW